jgi:outer membrane receptor protein involved in Fe transport
LHRQELLASDRHAAIMNTQQRGRIALSGRRRWSAVLLCVGQVINASAQTPVMEEMQVTATRTARPARNVSQGVGVRAFDGLSATSIQIVPEALRDLPGAFLQQTTPGQGAAIVRGLKGSQVLHLVDGMRLNNALFRNAPTQYLALVDTFAVERLEVVRGPASTLYGSDAMGGAVQVITREPRFAGKDWQMQGHAIARYASADRGKTVHLGLDAGHENLSLGGGVSYQDVGNRRAGGGESQRPSDYEVGAADVRVLLTPDPSREWQLDLQYLRQPETPRYDELNPGFDQVDPAAATFLFEPNDRLFIHAQHRRTVPAARIDELSFDISYQEINDDRRTREFASAVEIRERNQSALYGANVQAWWAGAKHSVVAGGELYLDRVSSRRWATDLETGQSTTVPSRFPDEAEMDSIGFYVHDDWQLHPRLSVQMGIRYSAFDIELPPAERGVDLDLDDFTGGLGLSYALRPELRLMANVSRGFRPPNVFDLGALGPRPGDRFNVPNLNLDAERIWTYDAGLKLTTNRVIAELYAYYSEISDQIVSVSTGVIDADGREIFRSDNLSEVELWGVEAGLDWSVADWIDLSAGLNYTWGEERIATGERQPADRIPPLNGRLGVKAAPAQNWQVQAYLRFAAEQDRLSDRDFRDPRIDPTGTAGWGTVNLRVVYQPLPSLTLNASLENAGDKRYREHGSGIDAAGRNVILGIDLRF